MRNVLSTNSFKEKEVLYFFYNDDCEGNKKLKNVINIINKQKLKLLQVSSNNFTIKTMKPHPKGSGRFPMIYKKKNNYFEREVKIRRDKNYYNNNNFNKAHILSTKKLNKQENAKLVTNKSKKLSLKNNKSSKSEIKSLKYNLRRTPNQSISFNSMNNNNKYNNEKGGKFYNNLYQNHTKKRMQNVKSADSFLDSNRKRDIGVKMDSYKQYKKYNDIRKNEKDNRKLIEKLFKIHTGFASNNSNQYIYYNKHFGNNDNCPICQSIEHKNEETIQKLGISRMTPNISNEKTNNSWKKRRVYSALTKILSKKGNKNNNKFEL